MSIGKVTAAAFAGTMEHSLSLVHINFDFSLCKVEAPSEYQGVGSCLSRNRSNDAEEGASHVTARKLGALFGDVIPKTPNLIRAYGLRASEIIKSPIYNPKSSKVHGVFAEQVGADATTIWAAATSGNEAIAVHLLACMLARIWPIPEAVSIWVELVKERHRVLTQEGNSSSSIFGIIPLSKFTLTREELANWDASARAWLYTADQAKELPQKQLMLIINNLGLRVNDKLAVYDGVMQAWTSAMTVVDQLIQGIPQKILEGAPLLGLSSWHLYPNMTVIQKEVKNVVQNDDLIAEGGLVTLGLQQKGLEPQGISWSLPLAHLRYYGNSEIRSGTLNEQSSRISIDQLLQVAMGSLLGPWAVPINDLCKAAKFFPWLKKCVSKDTELKNLECSWVDLLASAAETFLARSNGSDDLVCQLVNAGRRRYPSFLKGQKNDPFFGLADPKILLRLMNEDDRIRVLRSVAKHIAKQKKFKEQSIIIRYRHYCENASHASYGLTLVTEESLSTDAQETITQKLDECIEMLQSKLRTLDRTCGAEERLEDVDETEKHTILLNDALSGFGSILFGTCGEPESCTVNSSQAFPDTVEDSGTDCSREEPRLSIHAAPDNSHSLGALYAASTLIFGDIEVASLHLLEDKRSLPLEHVPTSIICEILDKDYIRPDYLPTVLWRRLVDTKNNLPLCGLATVAKIYRSMPGASLSLKVAETPLKNTAWLAADTKLSTHPCSPPSRRQLMSGFVPYPLNLKSAFSCIILFDSGTFDIPPSNIKDVFAVSSGNSIYIADRLLTDPVSGYRSTGITRFIGSLGKPGISLLTTPLKPKIRDVDENWKCINHFPFDGRPEDCFQDTSLHLGFSGWEAPLDVGKRGLCDKEIRLLEAPISLYCRGNWVADLNVLDFLSPEKGVQVVDDFACMSSTESQSRHSDCDKSLPDDFVTIEQWEELIDHPAETAVVKASGNWQARLAAATLAAQLGYDTRLVTESVCWDCCLNPKRIYNSLLEKSYKTDDSSGDENDSINSGHGGVPILSGSLPRTGEREHKGGGGIENSRGRSPATVFIM